MCDDLLPPGGAEVDLAVLFADVRGSTGLGERRGASAFAALLNRFYAIATEVLLAHDAIIDKMVGDEVMALFLPNSAPEYRANAPRAALALLGALGYGSAAEPWLPVGVGVHYGTAYVGKVGGGGVHDFTALGDTVTTAARLQSEAARRSARSSASWCAPSGASGRSASTRRPPYGPWPPDPCSCRAHASRARTGAANP